MPRTLNDGSPAGYGVLDRAMAEALSAATSSAEADKIARDNGLKDAAAAWNWLRDRS